MIKTKYKWINKYDNTNDEKIKNIDLDIDPIVKKLLVSRGIDNKEKMDEFFNASISDLYNPFLILDMDKATDKIISSIKDNKKIVIYGDYDVDGITSTTILFSYLKEIGCDVFYYIPNRLNEGYGINLDAINQIKENGCDLIITVDTGIVATNEVKEIIKMGIDVVVTDHHEMQDDIPKCSAVCDSKRTDDTYPFKELAGCGVSYKLCVALDSKIKNDSDDEFKKSYEEKNIDVNKYLELACLGTIADIVPLVSENRIIVREGLKLLPKTKRIGLKLLLEETIPDSKNYSARDIAFNLIPKMNAAGRIADASMCVELLLEEDELNAKKLVKDIIKNNDERKKIEQKIFDEAKFLIDNNASYDNEKIIIIKNEKWHHGVIGIVAARLCDTYFKPVIMCNEEDGVISGSARTCGSVNIFDLISNGKNYLSKFGGHEGACGLSMESKNFDKFKKKIVEIADSEITKDLLIPNINYDLEIDASDISLELANELKLLEPFGACNEEPIFKIRTKITNASLMGKANDHLRLKAKSLDNINSFDMVGFFMGDKFEHIVYDKEYLSCGTININEFMGNKKIQFMLNDITNNDEDHIRNEYYKSKYSLVMSKFDGKMQVSLVEGITEDIYNDKDFVNSVDNFNDFDKLINNTDNLENPVKIMVLDKLDNLINIKKMYGDKVEIYYNNLDEKIAQNCIIKDKKPLIVLANNIVKFVDLRKNYTIIYSDSLDSFKNKEVEAIFGVLKDDVIMTYKRLLYLDKTSNNEVYFDDLLYNLKELDLYKVLLSIEILNELNIITSEINLDNEKVSFNINEGVKNPIENSKLFARYKI
ncbi:MAG: single-stranded-DNA-specific exonuclease RecJ [Clostridia bacterium]|nr:single-stranded-DNA-specific exonuclease RecJ [Clostridia bacterium]